MQMPPPDGAHEEDSPTSGDEPTTSSPRPAPPPSAGALRRRGAWALPLVLAGVVAVVPAGSAMTPRSDDTAPLPYPTRSVAMYHMVWSEPEATPLDAIPADVNVVNLAFAQGDPPALAGWGAEGQARFVERARALRARGVRIVLSVGGEDGEVELADRRGFVDGVMAINDLVPLDGIDWDVETEAPSTADVVAISAELRRLRGADFAVTLAPNGSSVEEYVDTALALDRAGHLTRIGQQFYDAVVPREAALERLDDAVSAGIPAEKYAVGMMVGDGEQQWTVDECAEHLAFLLGEHPDLGGAYLWESGRAGADDWADRVSALLTS